MNTARAPAVSRGRSFLCTAFEEYAVTFVGHLRLKPVSQLVKRPDGAFGRVQDEKEIQLAGNQRDQRTAHVGFDVFPGNRKGNDCGGFDAVDGSLKRWRESGYWT